LTLGTSCALCRSYNVKSEAHHS